MYILVSVQAFQACLGEMCLLRTLMETTIHYCAPNGSNVIPEKDILILQKCHGCASQVQGHKDTSLRESSLCVSGAKTVKQVDR